jgi:hypothetical protein
MDIADLVLEDHHRQRKSFALLDETDPANDARLAAIWGDLADFLEAHAAAEEAVLYPRVLELSDPDASETKDAIGDHYDIRDAITRATSEDVGSDGWWKAVGAARAANTEHEVLPHLRRRAAIAVRTDMGLAFEVAKTSARRAQLDTSDKAPDDYVVEHT